MLFRYDFGKILDTTKFKSQIEYYIGKFVPLHIVIIIGNYELSIEIIQNNNSMHVASFILMFLEKDLDGEILAKSYISPSTNLKFKDFPVIQEIFYNNNSNLGLFTSSSNKLTVSKIVEILNILFKIEKLKAFL